MAKTKDTTPKFLSLSEAKKYAGKPIGVRRLLTIFEDNNLGIVGGSRRDVKHLKPDELEALADSSGADMSKHVGS